jgi:signal transduction histidine kinase/HD-like signal output (HDOD) protein
MQINKTILNQISTIKNLPTLPHILIKLIRACSEDEPNLTEISKIIEKDPSLSSKILTMVNSAFYGLPEKVESIHQSVAFLGTSTIKNIAIGASIYQTFIPAKTNTFINLKFFWWHSLRCAVLARLIAKKVKYNNPDEAFLAGLLHDIGKLILWVNYPKEYTDLFEKHKDRPDLLLAGEIRLGVTHCEIGAWLIHRWNLQSFLSDAVLYHHEPTEKVLNAFSLVQIVYVSNALSQMPVQGQDKGNAIAEDIYGFPPSQVEELLSQADKELGAVAHSLDIDIEAPEESEGLVSEKDRKKQEDLVREVRDISLLLGTLQNLLEAHDEDTILGVVHQGLQILFDAKDIYFFLHDPEKAGLIGKAVTENEKSSMISDLIIPMQTEGSLLVTSLLQGKPLELFFRSTDAEPIIIDAQIIRFIGREGMLCLPMLAQGEYVGVIVLGLNQVEFTHVSKHFKLLNMFTDQAALALHADQMRRAPLKKIQSERVGASAAIARKVVHEVNNPLSIIKNYLKILGTKLSEHNIAQDEIRILNKEIDHVAHILRALTSFSESEVSNPGPVNINALLSDLVKITRESLRKHSKIEVHLDLKPTLPTVITEENSLKQVFVNLIKNAAEAMTEGGNLYVKTRHISSQLEDASVPEGGEYQGYVEITISDDGPGIPDKIRSRLFEPFVTSKSDGHSGLGLSIVHNLIKTLNGTIMCESDEAKGTSFKIELPVAINQDT